MNDQTWWYVARATGLVAYGLLATSVFLGLLLTSRLLGRRPPPDWLLDWHRFVGALALVFTAAHLGGIWLDDYVEFDLDDLFVPFASDWRPVGVGFGVVTLYLVLVVETTSRLRRHMSRRLWRNLHHLSLPAFTFATVHLVMSGEDASEPLVLAGVGATVGAVLVLIGAWFARSPDPAPRPRDDH